MIRLGWAAALVMTGLACAGEPSAAPSVPPDPESIVSDPVVQHLASAWRMDPSEVKVQDLAVAFAPGVRFFAAHAGERTYTGGMVRDGVVVTSTPETMDALLDAWVAAPTTAEDLAGMLARMEDVSSKPRPILKQRHIDLVREDWQSAVSVPTIEDKADGTRVIVYWTQGDDPPLWRSVVTFGRGGFVSFDKTDIDQVMKKPG